MLHTGEKYMEKEKIKLPKRYRVFLYACLIPLLILAVITTIFQMLGFVLLFIWGLFLLAWLAAVGQYRFMHKVQQKNVDSFISSYEFIRTFKASALHTCRNTACCIGICL